MAFELAGNHKIAKRLEFLPEEAIGLIECEALLCYESIPGKS